MSDADWWPYTTPVVLRRSVKVYSTGGSYSDWPVLDLGFATAKVKVGANVTLSFTRVVLLHWRKGPQFLAPGLDLIATNNETANRAWDASVPNLRFYDMAWIQRGCLLPQLGQQATYTMVRPAFAAGNQSLAVDLPQPGCIDSDTAPLMQRCWPMSLHYNDVVTDGYNFDNFGGRTFAGYVVWLENTPVRCEGVLSVDCVAAYTAVGCFLTMYPNDTGPAPTPGSKDAGSKYRVAAIIGGVLGAGWALLAMVGGLLAVVVVIRGRRRRRRPSSDGMVVDGPEIPPHGPGGDLLAAMASCSISVRSGGGPLGDPSKSRTTKGWTLDEPSVGWGASGAATGDQQATGPPDSSYTGLSQQQSTLTFMSTLRDGTLTAPVTPHTPLKPDVNLQLSLGTEEVVLLPGVIGRGAFGRVMEGRYAGQPVAVKLLDYGLLMQCRGGGGGRAAAAAAAAAAATTPVPPLAPAVAHLSIMPMIPETEMEPATDAAVLQQHKYDLPYISYEASGGGGAATVAAVPVRPTVPDTSKEELNWPREAKSAPAAVAAKRGEASWRPVKVDAALGNEVGSWVDGDDGGGTDAAAAGAAAAQLHSSDLPSCPEQHGLVQEVEVLARCRHPNVVRLLAACLQPPHMCLVMELMETSMDRLLYGAGPGGPLLTLNKVLHIGLQIAAGLEYLHPTIMHRDLKPANVLLQNAASPTPIVKLADFGLSRLQTSVLVTANVGVGTIAYMAPETLSAMNCVVTHHVDIYALGVILWEMLAGVRPWAGLDLVQIAVAVEMRRRRPPLEVLSAERCPPKLRSLIQRCWDHVPERRPAAAEVVKELLLMQLMLLQDSKKVEPSSSTGSAGLASSLQNTSGTDPVAAAHTGVFVAAGGLHPVGEWVAALACRLPSQLPPAVASALAFAE